jgi:GMP synthase (glutamine-hydrolysing)
MKGAMENNETVVILDFGSQYTQVIARKVRELGVKADIYPPSTPAFSGGVKGIIFSGGPMSVGEEGAAELNPGWLKQKLPVLGICYGMQLLAENLGGTLKQSTAREYGPAEVSISDPSQIFHGLPTHTPFKVWMSHGDHVTKLPKGYVALAESNSGTHAAMANEAERIYAIQFHPEVHHTTHGKEILKNFLFRICSCAGNWKPAHFVESTINSIKQTVGESATVVCALSGGVDSTVAAVLVHKAIGKRLHCVFVDNGLLRYEESAEVLKLLAGLGLNVELADAADIFFSALKNVTDPEEKRKIIGRVFIEIFDKAAKKIHATHLVQGTLYPDVIESISVKGPSATIKSHHNVGGLPEKMHLKLIEPLRDLFKDEVRRVGKEIGIPSSILERQPFPGPGLAVRTLGEVTPARVELVRHADKIFREEMASSGHAKNLWQCFAVLLPVKSVGVMGDGRTYEETIALRAVTSEDGMTADWYDVPNEVLRRASSRITNEVHGVNRVVFDISSKPPATIEWE